MEILPSAPSYVPSAQQPIEGTQWTTLPETGNVPLVPDMSSDIAARPHRREKYGVIFAGAQKILAPSGSRWSWSARTWRNADKNFPRFCSPHAYQGEVALSHAPDVRGLHRRPGIGMDRSEGGIRHRKAQWGQARLCSNDTIESSGAFYSCPVEKACAQNDVVCRVAGGDDSIERKFRTEAAAARLVGTPGHRSVGGMRVSLYTLLPLKPWKP